METLGNGFIDWFEFEPQKDTFIGRTLPVETKKATESGLILQAEDDSVVNDRPDACIVVSVGETCKYKVGDFLYLQKGMGYDLKQVRKENDQEFILLYPDAVIGKKVQDTRTTK